MHDLQTDRYFVVSGDVRVVLFDGRENSPTAGSIVQVNFTDRTPGSSRSRPASGTPTRTGGKRRRTSSTSPLAPTTLTARTSTGSIPTATRSRSTGPSATDRRSRARPTAPAAHAREDCRRIRDHQCSRDAVRSSGSNVTAPRRFPGQNDQGLRLLHCCAKLVLYRSRP